MDIYVLGVGQIECGECRGLSIGASAQKAAGVALLDAGLSGPDVSAVYFAGLAEDTCGKSPPKRGKALLSRLKVGNVSGGDVLVEVGGGAAALNRACLDLGEDVNDVALVIGVDLAMEPVGLVPPRGGRDHGPGDGRGARRESLAFEALAAAKHMARFGTTREELAGIAAKNRYHGTLNPRSRHEPMTAADVLAAPLVAPPLTRAMCAFAAAGAAAAVVCTGRFLQRLGAPRPVRIRASVCAPGHGQEADPELGLRELAAKAWAVAGLGPKDVDCAELHDPTAYAELRETELLGFCGDGEGGRFASSGASTLGGRLPVNTSGGLVSRGHAPNASGLMQVCELVTQLRGEGCSRQVGEASIGLSLDAGVGASGRAAYLHILEAAPAGR